MPKILKLTTLPHDEAVLRRPNSEVKFPLSEELKRLVEDMKATVKKAPGVGLAATQVGKNLMIAIINLEEMGIPAFALINPVIVSKSIKKSAMEEGCLSIPGLWGQVRRPAKVEVEGYREDGVKIQIKAEKLLARVLQHEIDHLNGTLIIDKIKK